MLGDWDDRRLVLQEGPVVHARDVRSTLTTRITCSRGRFNCDGKYHRYIVHENTENLKVLLCGDIDSSVA